MAVSKLFTPRVHAKETSVDDKYEKDDMFLNVPVHPGRRCDLFGATDSNAEKRTLRMSKNSGQETSFPEDRDVYTWNGKVLY